MKKPKISVFMAAYNASAFIAKSIDSVLNQTFADFELIILNDGSTDDTVSVIEQFDDPRIKLIHNDQNMGLTFTRNRIKDVALGDFIAILDSDDVARVNRLKLQYDFLSTHPEIALCGGHAQLIDTEGKQMNNRLNVPVKKDLPIRMLFANPFVNSTTMFKKSVFDELGGYRDYAPAEDFDLFERISENYGVANLDEILVDYRIHQDNTSTVLSEALKYNEQRIIENMQRWLGLKSNAKSVSLHFEIFAKKINPLHLLQYFDLLREIKAANTVTCRYDQALLAAFVHEKWYEVITAPNISCNALNLFFRKGLFYSQAFTFKQLRKAIKKSIKSAFKKTNYEY